MPTSEKNISNLSLKGVFTLLITFCTFLSCNNSPGEKAKDPVREASITELNSSIETIEKEENSPKNYGAQDNNPLFVFVGEKISEKPVQRKFGDMDNGIVAKYAILNKVFGEFPFDTIEFVAYDHFGAFSFINYKNVLLYVSADSGQYYQQKYMYNDVYKTKNGRWAGPYSSEDYEHEYNKKTKVKPVRIEFVEDVSYPIERIDGEGNILTFSPPKPYFIIKGERAIPVYGNYVEDLFILKRDGFLTAREIFKNGKLVK